MDIRVATEKDLDTIEALFEDLDALHRDRLPNRFRAPTEPARSREHLNGLFIEPSAILIADDTGFIHVTLREPPPLPIFVPRRFVRIENIIVAARARRRGIGRALFAAAESWAKDRGATELELTVYTANHEALAFYRALGFTDLAARLARAV